jgi:hypothetical protein
LSVNRCSGRQLPTNDLQIVSASTLMWGSRSLANSALVPLPSQDGVHNGKPGHSGNVTDDRVDLQVHLCQRLVHVLHMLTGGHDQLAAVPQYCPNGANILLGSKRSTQ